MNRTGSLAFAFVSLLSSAALAGTNCFGTDALDGPCCSFAQPRLPGFPAIQQTVRYVCFDSCQTRISANVCATLGAPHPALSNGNPICGLYLISVTIQSCGPTPQLLWSGTMRAQYVRNWFETSPGSPFQDLERWRFLLNGDMAPSSFLVQQFGNNVCVVPPCSRLFRSGSHFSGFVDYVQSCVAGSTQAVWVLDHDCDAVEHGPSSARPGTFHPTESYDFVGPSASFQLLQHVAVAPRGTAIDQTCRPNDWQFVPNICTTEEAVSQRTLDPRPPVCPCGSAGGTATQYVPLVLQASGQCGSQFASDSADPLRPSKKLIGAWTNPNVWPGEENLYVVRGDLQYVDGCAPGATHVEFFQGIETVGGFVASNFALLVLPPEFDDLASANRGPSNRATLVGAPSIAFEILSLNQ
jgi:hypothetical protein